MAIEKSVWTGDRIAKLGYLVGAGLDARRIAAHPKISTTSNNVYRTAQRFGLRFSEVAKSFQIAPAIATVLEAEAAARGYTLDTVLAKLLSTCAAEPHLIWNVIDDDC